jgi:lipopolysaccharide export system protein LptA
VAVQGDVRLTAEKMTVFYRQSGDNAKEQKADSGAAAGGIRKIEVEQNVFLTTPEETASGNSGVYNVENQQIQLHQNVVLTKDKNTLKGDKLTYDFSTGKSVLSSNGSQPSVNSASGEKGKQRVRALFIPEGAEQKAP